MAKTSLPVHTETLAEALEAVEIHFTAQGFNFGEDWVSLSNPFLTGGIPYQTTKAHTFQGTRQKGKALRVSYLHVSLYRMESGRYELTAYVS